MTERVKTLIQFLKGLLPNHPVINQRATIFLELFDNSLGFFPVDPIGTVQKKGSSRQ